MSAKRKSPTRGWSKQEPSRVTTRRKMRKKCGSGCFLEPKKLKYPICAKSGANVCKPSCKGMAAAFNRARQQGRNDIAKKALRRAKRFGCSWQKTGAKAQELSRRWRV